MKVINKDTDNKHYSKNEYRKQIIFRFTNKTNTYPATYDSLIKNSIRYEYLLSIGRGRQEFAFEDVLYHCLFEVNTGTKKYLDIHFDSIDDIINFINTNIPNDSVNFTEYFNITCYIYIKSGLQLFGVNSLYNSLVGRSRYESCRTASTLYTWNIETYWDSGITYEIGDEVMWMNKAYRSTQVNNNIQPDLNPVVWTHIILPNIFTNKKLEIIDLIWNHFGKPIPLDVNDPNDFEKMARSIWVTQNKNTLTYNWNTNSNYFGQINGGMKLYYNNDTLDFSTGSNEVFYIDPELFIIGINNDTGALDTGSIFTSDDGLFIKYNTFKYLRSIIVVKKVFMQGFPDKFAFVIKPIGFDDFKISSTDMDLDDNNILAPVVMGYLTGDGKKDKLVRITGLAGTDINFRFRNNHLFSIDKTQIVKYLVNSSSKSKMARGQNKMSILLLNNGYAISSNNIKLNKTRKIYNFELLVE